MPTDQSLLKSMRIIWEFCTELCVVNMWLEQNDCSTRASIAIICVCVCGCLAVYSFIKLLIHTDECARILYSDVLLLKWATLALFYSRVNYPIYVNNYCCVECNEVWLASASTFVSDFVVVHFMCICMCACVLCCWGFSSSLGSSITSELLVFHNTMLQYSSLIIESIFCFSCLAMNSAVSEIVNFASPLASFQINCTASTI